MEMSQNVPISTYVFYSSLFARPLFIPSFHYLVLLISERTPGCTTCGTSSLLAPCRRIKLLWLNPSPEKFSVPPSCE